MIDPTGGSFGSIEKIQRDIDSIKNMKNEIRDRIKQDIRDATPFDEVLQQKTSGESASIDDVIRQEAQQRGLDEQLVQSVIQVESGFDPNAVSDKGARGLMQLMPETADELGVNPDDPVDNVKGGTEYLARQLDEFGNLKEALAAYNAGPEPVKEHGGVPPFPETQNYVKQVMETFRNNKQTQ